MTEKILTLFSSNTLLSTLLGYQIEVYTDYKNLVYKKFITERVMRCWLLLKEFGPELHYVKRNLNIVKDALSWLQLTEKEFAPDIMVFSHKNF